ncbi:hypothetical protein RIF23_13780 [Lipingzhangella sp. LS1_29]|uniref:Tripartite-type tricarboxylate transporter receptor subunit TctC n=1 Tax=Lipingzhangella rawalii TaxID=2055835 RepID=A0ABU2H7V7_9ACTN|nr:hypothetical protein [Lipingzhangella rawalii]MDS1271368.1 hypothetical protein [Lipingzhangella rawalii]
MHRGRRSSQVIAVSAGATLLLASCANDPGAGTDGEFPNGTVRIVVGSGPGSTMDHLARGLAPHLQDMWGESVAVENVEGANQSAGYHEVANSDPDGHDLFIGVHGTFGIHEHLGNLEPGLEEFEWFGTLLEEPYAFHADADGPFGSFDDLLDDQPIRYGDSGYESPVNPFALTVFDTLDADYVFTPGYDPGEAQSSVLTGEQDVVGRDAAQMLRTGTADDYEVLLVATEEEHPLAPDAMTFPELEDEYDVELPVLDIFQLGFPIGTTPGTPEETVDILADSVRELIEDDAQFQEWMEDNHMSESMQADRIGREVTQEHVADVLEQYEDFGVTDLEERLGNGAN